MIRSYKYAWLSEELWQVAAHYVCCQAPLTSVAGVLSRNQRDPYMIVLGCVQELLLTHRTV